jgi:hypothetical protein
MTECFENVFAVIKNPENVDAIQKFSQMTKCDCLNWRVGRLREKTREDLRRIDNDRDWIWYSTAGIEIHL